MSKRALLFAIGAALAWQVLAAAPARADDAAELDPLSFATEDTGPGLAMARGQADGGDLLAALATLERVAMAHPEAGEAQLLHASLLCRVDDPAGAALEFAHLNKRAFARSVWGNAMAACTKPAPSMPQTAKPEPAVPDNPAAPPKPRSRSPRWSRPGF